MAGLWERIQEVRGDVTAIKNDKSNYKMISKLEDRIDDLYKKTMVLQNDDFTVTLNKVPQLQNKLFKI